MLESMAMYDIKHGIVQGVACCSLHTGIVGMALIMLLFTILAKAA